MQKNAQTGSFLAKHFPTLFKHFSENASQEDFNKAEQEAAVVFEQHQSGTESGAETPTVGADLAALFPNSHHAIAEKLSADEIKAFTTDGQEVQNRLSAQGQGNQAVSDDLTKARTELTKAQSDLSAAYTKIAELSTKATAWDAHKAALAGAGVLDDSTNTKPGKTGAATGLTETDQKHLDKLTTLKAKYPGLMADIDVPVQE